MTSSGSQEGKVMYRKVTIVLLNHFGFVENTKNKNDKTTNSEQQARFLEMTSKYEEEEKIRRRGYVEEDPADSGNISRNRTNPK